jgi:hypothetical protein
MIRKLTRVFCGPRVKEPLTKFGQPRMRAFCIMLTPDQHRTARAIGDGNISAGVRRALETDRSDRLGRVPETPV